MDKGYIRLFRSIQNSDDWTAEPFTRSQAWIDLLLLANYTDSFIRIRGIKVQIKRGQIGWSEQRLSERWKWSRNKFRRFINELKTKQQIIRKPIQQNLRLTSFITIINYDKYQLSETTESTSNETSNETSKGTVRSKDKERKKEYIDQFEAFWELYPKKVAKKKTLQSWIKIKPTNSMLEKILSALQNQIKSDQWQTKQYIPNPTTWLNQERWKDEPSKSSSAWQYE